MRVLIVCTSTTPYVIQLWEQIKKYYPDVKYSLLTLDQGRDYFSSHIELKDGEQLYFYSYDKLYLNLRKTIKELPQFDIIHFLWIERQMGLLANLLKKKGKHIFTSVGGSDLYRDSRQLHVKLWQKRLLRISDWISSENIGTKEYFYQIYGEEFKKIPHSVIRFGVDIIDAINENVISKNDLRTKWDIPQDKLVVVCGHNGRREHQHLEMIAAISRLPKETLEQYFFVIPMTYLVPSEEYAEEIRDAISRITDQFVILRDFMTVKEMAELTILSDAMIHVQTTDQLSSTMVAHMYEGNIVIAGDWLPYESLRDEGVQFYSISDFGKLTWYLEDICGKIKCYCDECRDNREAIYRLSSWESMSKEWYGVYERLISMEERK